MSEKKDLASLVLPTLRAMQTDITDIKETLFLYTENLLRVQEQLVKLRERQLDLKEAVVVVPDDLDKGPCKIRSGGVGPPVRILINKDASESDREQ